MALKPMSNRGSSEKIEARHNFAPRSFFGMDGFGPACLSDNSNYPMMRGRFLWHAHG